MSSAALSLFLNAVGGKSWKKFCTSAFPSPSPSCFLGLKSDLNCVDLVVLLIANWEPSCHLPSSGLPAGSQPRSLPFPSLPGRASPLPQFALEVGSEQHEPKTALGCVSRSIGGHLLEGSNTHALGEENLDNSNAPDATKAAPLTQFSSHWQHSDASDEGEDEAESNNEDGASKPSGVLPGSAAARLVRAVLLQKLLLFLQAA